MSHFMAIDRVIVVGAGAIGSLYAAKLSSHGTADQILPIDQCSRMIVPALRGRHYDVMFKEFPGRHEIPAEIAAEGLRWFVDTSR